MANMNLSAMVFYFHSGYRTKGAVVKALLPITAEDEIINSQ